MTEVIEIASWACLLVGGFFLLVGALGLMRFPDVFCRLHATSVSESMGAWLILIGLMLQAGMSLITVKLILILLFLIVTSPTSAHALAKAALHAGLKPIQKGDTEKGEQS